MPNRWGAGWLRSALTVAVLAAFGGGAGPAVQTPPTGRPPAPKTVRLYVFDCGLLNITSEGVQRYHVTPAEVGETRMSVPCFLIAHPKGTLMWELGVIPDGNIRGGAAGDARDRQCLRGSGGDPNTGESTGADRLPAGGHHLRRLLAPAYRPLRERQRLCGLDVAGHERRSRFHVGREQHPRQPVLLHRAEEQHVRRSSTRTSTTSSATARSSSRRRPDTRRAIRCSS